MKNYIIAGVCTFLLMGVVFVPSARADHGSVAEQIEALLAQVAELQNELAKLRGDIREVIKDGLKEGMTDEDIKEVQELLASDPSIYPEGMVTGYFGALTKSALKRFQERHGANPTGEIDEDTKALLEEYLNQGFGDKIPPGLLRAPGIMKKVQDGLCDGTHHGTGPLCKMYKADDEDEDDEEEDEDEDDHEHDDDFDVELEIEDGETTVEFTFDGDDYEVEVASDDLDNILDEVADAIEDGDTAEDLDEDLADAIEHAYDEATEDSDEESAQKAIDDAEDAINDADDAIDDSEGDTDDAETKLDEAEDKLEEAQTAFDDEDYEEAEDLADDAEVLAEEAEELADDAE